MANFVFSPSNIDTYLTCPRRFQAQSLTKELSWKPSTQKSRGTQVHNALEQAVKKGFDAVTEWPDNIDLDFCRNQIENFHSEVSEDRKVMVEHELVVKYDMTPTKDWWDKNALLRARADMVVLTPDHATIYDFKTGRMWDNRDGLQLRIEALLAHLTYGVTDLRWEYWYVDQGEVVKDRAVITPERLIGHHPKFYDIIQTIRDMKIAMRSNHFPAQRNKFCKWCGLSNCTEYKSG